MLTPLTKTSFFWKASKSASLEYYSRRLYLGAIYRNSQAHILTANLLGKTKACVAYSFPAQFYSAVRHNNAAILRNTKLIFLREWYKKIKDRTPRYLKTSAVIGPLNEIKNEINVSKIRMASIFLLAVILTNTAFLLLLKRQISPFSWFFRGISLVAGITGLSAGFNWQKLKAYSLLLKIYK